MRIVTIGWRYAAVVLAIGLAPALLFPPVGIIVTGLTLGIIWFFRDPTRHAPGQGLVSPADGRVELIRQEGSRLRLGIYMNVLNVHVNRVPINGSIIHRQSIPGGYWPAFAEAAERNERVDFVIDAEVGEVEVSLIAGSLARVITPYVDVDDQVVQGDRIGHIAFGSRVDVVLPAGITHEDVLVTPGDRVTAGESMLVAEQAIRRIS